MYREKYLKPINREELLDKRITQIRKQNKKLEMRHAEIEADKREAATRKFENHDQKNTGDGKWNQNKLDFHSERTFTKCSKNAPKHHLTKNVPTYLNDLWNFYDDIKDVNKKRDSVIKEFDINQDDDDDLCDAVDAIQIENRKKFGKNKEVSTCQDNYEYWDVNPAPNL